MDDSILAKSSLFSHIPVSEITKALEGTPYHMQRYDKEETIFHLMEPATRVGIILEGSVEVQKAFPNGSQVNVSIRMPGDVIGPAAVFSKSGIYPCDIVSLKPSTIMMFYREDLLNLMSKDARILENMMTEIASAAYMLQERLELFSYSGIAQKAAFWLLMQARQAKGNIVHIPGSIAKWAMLMNVSRPSLHRELKKLVDRSIISYAPPVIVILDLASLQKVLDK